MDPPDKRNTAAWGTLYEKPRGRARSSSPTEDRVHAAYDRDAVERFHRVLVQSNAVFKEFRGRFLGKCSPLKACAKSAECNGSVVVRKRQSSTHPECTSSSGSVSLGP